MIRTLCYVQDYLSVHHQLTLTGPLSLLMISIATDYGSKQNRLLVVDTASDDGKMCLSGLQQGLRFETFTEL